MVADDEPIEVTTYRVEGTVRPAPPGRGRFVRDVRGPGWRDCRGLAPERGTPLVEDLAQA